MSGDVINRVTGHWRTTLIGIVVLLFALAMTIVKVLTWVKVLEIEGISNTEILTTWALGYSFLMAKDSLLEGITLGLFKPKT